MEYFRNNLGARSNYDTNDGPGTTVDTTEERLRDSSDFTAGSDYPSPELLKVVM